MTDFIVYISAQQRMQAISKDAPSTDVAAPGCTPRVGRTSVDAARRQISLMLHHLADAIHPVGDHTGAPLAASHQAHAVSA